MIGPCEVRVGCSTCCHLGVMKIDTTNSQTQGWKDGVTFETEQLQGSNPLRPEKLQGLNPLCETEELRGLNPLRECTVQRIK